MPLESPTEVLGLRGERCDAVGQSSMLRLMRTSVGVQDLSIQHHENPFGHHGSQDRERCAELGFVLDDQ